MACSFVKEEFRWKLRKKGKNLLNICTHVLLYSGMTAGLMTSVSSIALAEPTGGNVVGGSATIVDTPDELQIHQTSDRTLIEWSSFDIEAGETTRFYQPGSDSIALNRVVNSNQLTSINGNLIANGRVVVINPNGVLIGAEGNIDTAAFIATAADMDDDAFMNSAGVLDFDRAGNVDAVVENRGSITVDEAGLAALVAPTVRNSGIVQGNMAKVQLAAADTFAVDFYGDGLIQFAVDTPVEGETRKLSVENSGSIIADGGQVLMTAAAASNVVESVINSDGYIQAASLESRNGKIVLTGAGADITVSGTMDVSGQGDADGGTINIGGDYQGKGALAKADTVEVMETAKLYADGGDNGDGGQIIVWSEEQTASHGEYYARGGSESGDGGLIETSSKKLLNVNGTVANTLAANGEVGDWLLDPDNINVTTSGAAHDDPLPATGTSNIDVASINNALSNVILAANLGVTFGTDVNIAASGVGLSVTAGVAGSDINGLEAGTGTISFTNQFIRTEGGDVSFHSGNSITQNNATIFTNGGDITMVSGDIGINNNAALGTEGGDVSLLAIAAGSGSSKTSGDVNTNSSFIDTTSPSSPGIGGITLTENGAALPQGSYGNPQNVFLEDENGGTITVEGKTIGGNSVCFAAGGIGCLVPDPVAVDIIVTIDDKQKIYGVLDPIFTWNVTSGSLTGGDTLDVDLARILGENVGNYNIFQDTFSVNGSGLYNISFVDGNLQIVTADIVLKAVDQNKIYGDTLTFDGTEYVIDSGQLFFSDNITSVDLTSAGAVATANVGNYDVDASNAQGTGLSNYSISYLDGTLSVDPKALTITAADQSKVYGDFFGFAGTEFATSGLVNSDSVSTIDLVSAGSPVTANVGNYAIDGSNASGAGLSNYTISYVDGTLNVTPAALTVTASDQGKIYGDTFSFAGTEFTTSGLVNSDAVTSVSLTSLGAPAGANVGNYDIDAASASGTGLGNYTISYVDGTLSVTPTSLTVTANDDGKIYDGLAYSDGNGVSYSGFVNGETDAVLGGALAFGGSSQGATDVGNYVIDASGLTSGNYTISYVDGALDITPAALTITADNQSKTYGGTFTFNGNEFGTSGLVGGETLVSATLGSTGSVNTASVAGSLYAITISNATGGTADLSNYTVTYNNGEMTVDSASLTITANDQNKTYGDVFTFVGTEFGTSGLVNGETLGSATLSSLGSPALAPVGTYAINISNATGGTADLNNYTVTYDPGTMTVDQAALLLITALDQSKTYGDTFAFAGTEFTPSGLVNSDTVTSVTLTSAGTVNTANVGDYAINASDAVGTGLSNYNISYADGTLSVTPASLTVTANDDGKIYDALAYSGGNGVSYSGFVNGETDAVLGGALAFGGSSQGAIDVGNYVIDASGLTSGNYTISYVDGTLNITPAALNVAITADDQSKTYGDTFTFAGTEFTTFGLLGTDSVTGVDLTSLGVSADADAGNYDIDASNASGTGLGNYTITYVDGTLSVTPAALTVAANDDAKIYDALAYSGGNGVNYSGFVNGEDASVLGGTLTFGGDSQGATNVGSYDISASGLTSGNYTISYDDGTLTITPARLLADADDVTKIYGDADPTLTFSTSGLQGSDSASDILSGSLERYPGENVGNYDIMQGTLTLVTDNYVLGFRGGELTITPATLTVNADPKNKLVGDLDPELTFSFSGLKFDDEIEDVLMGSLTREPGEEVGEYEIQQGSLDLIDGHEEYYGDEIETVLVISDAYQTYQSKGVGSNYNLVFNPNILAITGVSEPVVSVPLLEIDPLGRPIISVANQVIVLDEPFEEIETLELETDVGISSTGVSSTGASTTPEALAGITPAAGEDGAPEDQEFANLEPAAGGDSQDETAGERDEFARDIACANDFLDNKPCDLEEQ